MSLVYKDKSDLSKNVESKNFIGPSSLTLQIENICEINDKKNCSHWNSHHGVNHTVIRFYLSPDLVIRCTLVT